jgi:hypothetical protein
VVRRGGLLSEERPDGALPCESLARSSALQVSSACSTPECTMNAGVERACWVTGKKAAIHCASHSLRHCFVGQTVRLGVHQASSSRLRQRRCVFTPNEHFRTVRSAMLEAFAVSTVPALTHSSTRAVR